MRKILAILYFQPENVRRCKSRRSARPKLISFVWHVFMPEAVLGIFVQTKHQCVIPLHQEHIFEGTSRHVYTIHINAE